ncbi:MAG TPA: methylenetetrahydrofolate reductase [Candidatus Bathyarchaeia archaeon]|nr:methylenetetrahydrofolate reductase [Candidatus Bathyarchaeia archaeon]
MRLNDQARHHNLVTVELIPDRVVPSDLASLKGRVDAITVPALRNGHNDPSYPKSFPVTPQRRSLASASIINRAGITAVPSLTCRDCRRSDLSTISDQVRQGLGNVLIVYGDPYPEPHPGTYEFTKTNELIREVSSLNDGDGPCIGAVTNQHAKNRETEISKTILRVDAGANFIVTNVAFDSESVLDHRDSLLEAGLNVPLFVQVSIPLSLDNVLFVSQKFDIPVPAHVKEKLLNDPTGGSLAVAADAYQALRGEVNGIHFSYLFRQRNPIPAYRHLLETIGISSQTIAPLATSTVKTYPVA